MADTVYQPGDVWPLRAEIRDANGALTDATVTLTVRDPAGGVTTPSPVHASTGVYTWNFAFPTSPSATQYGVWEAIFSASGAVTATTRFTSVLERQSLTSRLSATALTTLADAREFVFRDVTDNTNDDELIRLINAYSAAVFRYTRREWLPQSTAVTRLFAYDGGGYLSFDRYDARSVTAVTMFTDQPSTGQVALTAADSVTEGQWRLYPRNGTTEGTYLGLDLPAVGWRGYFYSYPSQYLSGPVGFQVSVTGNWGVAADLSGVPDDVKLACLIAVADAYRNPEGLETRDIGELSFTEEPVAPGSPGTQARNLPPEARALLYPYRRGGAGVLVA